MRQVELDFEGGLVDRHPNFIDCVRASVYGCGRQFKAIAADLDMSPSALSQKLADQTDNNFALRRLPELIEATGNLDPIYWLIEKFCDSPEEKRRRAIEMLAQLGPRIEKLIKESAA